MANMRMDLKAMLYSQTKLNWLRLPKALQKQPSCGLSRRLLPGNGSTAPFACDLHALEQWLQFILLPRMQTLIETVRHCRRKLR